MKKSELIELIEHGEDPKVDPQLEQEIHMELGAVPLPEFMTVYSHIRSQNVG